MGIEFLKDHGARRLAGYVPQQPLFDVAEDADTVPDEAVDPDYEVPRGTWRAIPGAVSPAWRVQDWAERPARFIDGKDVGETVAWLQAPGGYPIPVRLSQIGGVAVRVEDGVCRREAAVAERVVSMTIDPFPWDEVESFAIALAENGYRLLPAQAPDRKLTYDFEAMRKAAQNRSNDEMTVLEEAVLAQNDQAPTVVDGRLEPRSGGFDGTISPVAGVIKTHGKNYLHGAGMQLLYGLQPGERTPVFHISGRCPVVSWYVRLVGADGEMPTWGAVRVELPFAWFEARKHTDGWAYIDYLSRFLREYRCRDQTYGRAAVSLHPIVRAEQLLGALFTPSSLLGRRFFRIANL